MMTSSHLFYFSSFIVSINLFPVSMVPSAKGLLEYCFLYASYRHCNGIQHEEAPDLTVCVAVDLLAAFDTVCHNNLLSKISRSRQLQTTQAYKRWSCHSSYKLLCKLCRRPSATRYGSKIYRFFWANRP